MNTKNFDKKILVVKTSSLGDIFQCFSVLTFLKSYCEGVQVDWVVEEQFAQVLHSHPNVRHVFSVSTKRWRKHPFSLEVWKEIMHWRRSLRNETYDVVFDLQGNMKSGLITKMAIAREKMGWSFKTAPEWPSALFLTKRFTSDLNMPASLHYLALVQSYFGLQPRWMPTSTRLEITRKEELWVESFAAKVSSPKLMVCIGSNWENKRLSLVTWKEVLDQVSEGYHPIFFFVSGTKREEQQCLELAARYEKRGVVAPKMSIPVWQRVIEQMDGVLAVDSCALHLAGTTNTPTFSFFGPSSSKVYCPIGKGHQAVQGPCPYGKRFTKRCPQLRLCPTGACLKEIPHRLFLPPLTAWLNSILQEQ